MPEAKTPVNKAALLTGPKVRPLEVKEVPYISPGSDQILIKVHALAVNPVDWVKQSTGDFMYKWMKYPIVLGTDVAGEVVEVGKQVLKYKPGDRVLGMAVGMEKKVARNTEGAFQEYVILRTNLCSRIPDSMTYEEAAVIPLGLSTAACGLYQREDLNLVHPSTSPKPTGKTLLIWGGSTSVGANAIQLAVSSGYEVITTCSPRNFELVKKWGASQAFDYNSKTVVQDIIRAFDGKTTAGAVAIGKGSMDLCFAVLAKCKGNKFVSLISYPQPDAGFDAPLYKVVLTFITWSIAWFFKSKLNGVKSKFVWGADLAWNNVGKVIYEDYLPQALEKGIFVPAPKAEVVGRSLEDVQKALDMQRKGVSAKKLVVTL